jgi:hypothetical protein
MHLSNLVSSNPVTFDLLADVTMTNTIIWDVTSCNMAEVYRRSSKTSVSFQRIPLRRSQKTVLIQMISHCNLLSSRRQSTSPHHSFQTKNKPYFLRYLRFSLRYLCRVLSFGTLNRAYWHEFVDFSENVLSAFSRPNINSGNG